MTNLQVGVTESVCSAQLDAPFINVCNTFPYLKAKKGVEFAWGQCIHQRPSKQGLPSCCTHCTWTRQPPVTRPLTNWRKWIQKLLAMMMRVIRWRKTSSWMRPHVSWMAMVAIEHLYSCKNFPPFFQGFPGRRWWLNCLGRGVVLKTPGVFFLPASRLQSLHRLPWMEKSMLWIQVHPAFPQDEEAK